MPYRIDIDRPPPNALDLLVTLGALDIEPLNEGLAAILPDAVAQDTVAASLGVPAVTVSAAVGRDNGSIWLLSPRAIHIGGVLIASPETAPPTALRLNDGPTFGTGHHPTTALCIQAIQQLLAVERVHRILDVGTGSGILALTALMSGVQQAVGLDIDADALQAASENARLNHLADRLHLAAGSPDVVQGQWPLIVANILAAPLIEMASVLVQRLARHGRLILSGIPPSLEPEVRQAYRHVGVRHIDGETRAGWSVLIAQSPW